MLAPCGHRIFRRGKGLNSHGRGSRRRRTSAFLRRHRRRFVPRSAAVASPAKMPGGGFGGKCACDRFGHKHGGELQAFGGVNGQDLHGVCGRSGFSVGPRCAGLDRGERRGECVLRMRRRARQIVFSPVPKLCASDSRACTAAGFCTARARPDAPYNASVKKSAGTVLPRKPSGRIRPVRAASAPSLFPAESDSSKSSSRTGGVAEPCERRGIAGGRDAVRFQSGAKGGGLRVGAAQDCEVVPRIRGIFGAQAVHFGGDAVRLRGIGVGDGERDAGIGGFGSLCLPENGVVIR